LKERVADDHYDPVRWLLKKVGGGTRKEKAKLPIIDQPSPTTRVESPQAKAKRSADADDSK